jgi:LPXTG-motif cell wall-anchored protein
LADLMFGALVFLFPVAAYFLFLAMINARHHPTVVSGPWDFAGVLFATSGFLLAAGPYVLNALYTGSRLRLDRGRLTVFSFLGSDRWGFWLALWGLYLGLIIGGAAWLLWRRRKVSVIYNVEPGALDAVLAQTLEHLQLGWTRVADRIFIGPVRGRIARSDPSLMEAIQAPGGVGNRPSGALAVSGSEGQAQETGREDGTTLPVELTERRAGLELEPFPAMHNVTLRWQEGDASVRRDVEADLARRLLEVTTPDNPAASWFLTVASCMFGVLFLGLVGFILVNMRNR